LILSSLLWEAISIPPACRSFVRLQIPPANTILTFCASRRVNLSLTCKCKNIPYFAPRSSKNIWPPFRKGRILFGPHNIEIKLKSQVWVIWILIRCDNMRYVTILWKYINKIHK
jgi:hypothetical protein